MGCIGFGLSVPSRAPSDDVWLIIRNCFPRAEVVQPLVFVYVYVQTVKAIKTAITSFDSQDQDNAQANKPLEVPSTSEKCAAVRCVTQFAGRLMVSGSTVLRNK